MQIFIYNQSNTKKNPKSLDFSKVFGVFIKKCTSNQAEKSVKLREKSQFRIFSSIYIIYRKVENGVENRIFRVYCIKKESYIVQNTNYILHKFGIKNAYYGEKITAEPWISSMRSIVYHQHEVLYIIRPKPRISRFRASISSSRREYTLKRDAYRLRYLASFVVLGRRIANMRSLRLG